jgi:hypothetical protein
MSALDELCKLDRELTPLEKAVINYPDNEQAAAELAEKNKEIERLRKDLEFLSRITRLQTNEK